MKPSIPQGTRDFGPETVRKRNYVLDVIRDIFVLYGFQPLETPAIENLETLLGKYGDEGDKLIFRIRSNRNLFHSDPDTADKIRDLLRETPDFDPYFLPGVSTQALRYDLTIPFARYVAMNYGQLTLPFKRYQIQPVWRGDRPQKGRYREFLQCDADIVGSNSLLSDVEFGLLYADVFERLGLDVVIKLNNRKILAALADACASRDRLSDITIAIDKIEKAGIENVKQDLLKKGLAAKQIQVIADYLSITGTNSEKIAQAEALLGNHEDGKTGLSELAYVMQRIGDQGQRFQVDFTLARGLNYYTGTIFEVKAQHVTMGSIGGGGRYDDLTGLFGVPNTPGVGISFGVDRIYDVLEELNLFPAKSHTQVKALFFNLGIQESAVAMNLLSKLRSKNVAAEIFYENAKFDKQFKYADRRNISYAIIIGSKEIENGTCLIKNLKTGIQHIINQSDIENFIFE